jgi:hypothetical protein
MIVTRLYAPERSEKWLHAEPASHESHNDAMRRVRSNEIAKGARQRV